MGVRKKKRETLKRLDSKTLDAQFLQEIQHGMNCSPFEAEAVPEALKEVYFPFLHEQSVKAPPVIETGSPVVCICYGLSYDRVCRQQAEDFCKEPTDLEFLCIAHSSFLHNQRSITVFHQPIPPASGQGQE